MTKAALICVVASGVAATVVFSPGFSFGEKGAEEPARVAAIGVSRGYAEVAEFQDSEPIFFPTQKNFGAESLPPELKPRSEPFLPFGEIFVGRAPKIADGEIAWRDAGSALGADAWEITEGFGSAPLDALMPAAASDGAKTVVRIEDLATGKIVFSGTLDGIDGNAEQTLPAPAELFCGVVSEFGRPRVITEESCGDADLDSKIEDAAAALVDSLNFRRGFYRVFVVPR